MPNQVEHIIRDWLVGNLEFVEPGLQLIEKEHYLPDEMGSSGFIDILCKDVYNNFVIIEIKRSDSAARQTFTEVLKYAALIQKKYNARDSEIKIVILSTHWGEILRAYSHLCFKSHFTIHGYQLFIDEQTKIPEAKEEIIPLSSRAFSRKFAYYKKTRRTFGSRYRAIGASAKSKRKSRQTIKHQYRRWLFARN